MKNWYVLRFASNRFRAVEGYLLLNNADYYCPMRNSNFTRSDKSCSIRKRITPLFPGYLFVHIDFETIHPEKLAAFQHIYGLVTFGREPLPVSQATIDIMKNTNWEEKASNALLSINYLKISSILSVTDPDKRSILMLNYLIENYSSIHREVKYAS